MYLNDVDHDWNGAGNHYLWDDTKKVWYPDTYHSWKFFVNYTLTKTEQIDDNHFIFTSDQSNLGGSLLTSNISVGSTNIRKKANS